MLHKQNALVAAESLISSAQTFITVKSEDQCFLLMETIWWYVHKTERSERLETIAHVVN